MMDFAVPDAFAPLQVVNIVHLLQIHGYPFEAICEFK